MITSYNQLSLPWLRLLVGTIFIFMGLFATISFLSQGFSGLTFLIIVAFCFGIEITKILLTGDVGFYLTLKMPEKAMFSGLIVLCLFCLSLTAETYFLMSGTLTDNAKLETVTGNRTALESQLKAKQAQLDKCPAGFITKCQKPLSEAVKAIEEELNKALSNETEQAALIANAKFWDMLAKVTGASHDNLVMFVNFIRAFLGEVIGLYLCGQFATYQRFKGLPPDNVTSNERNNAMRNAPPAQPIQPPKQERQVLPSNGYSFKNLKW